MTDREMSEQLAKLDIEESGGFYSAYINDMRISKNKPLSVSKTVMTFDCPKKYILEAIGIPDGVVVLTKEEYERFQRIENTLKHISTTPPTEAERENKALKETIAIVLAQKRNIWNSYNQLKEEIECKVNQASKQVIKEFVAKVENRLDSVDVILHEDNDEEYVSLNGVLSLIDQAIKEAEEEQI